MTSAVNVRSQLIPVIFIFVGVIIQCDASISSGKVLNAEDFHSYTNTPPHQTELVGSIPISREKCYQYRQCAKYFQI